MAAPPGSSSRLDVFASFPSSYTQSLILSALTSVLPRLSISSDPPLPSADPTQPTLQWADYDLLTLDLIPANPTTQLISSYIYRKTLIRKQNLQRAVDEYRAKVRYRGQESVLEESIPRGWTVEIQWKDELEEMLMDELYDLREEMQANEDKEERDRKWFILKPGMSDKAQGIRMFSTEDELISIFEEFEPASDDGDETDEHEEGEEDEEEDRTARAAAQSAAGQHSASHDRAASSSSSQPPADALREMILKDFPDDEPYEEPEEGDATGEDDEGDDEDEEGTGVRTSQLRHFVIQEYVDRPILFSVDPDVPAPGHKFHIRAYVLLTGTYKLYLARTMLALFAGEPYVSPGTGDDINLFAHLTNTCLQAKPDGSLPEHLVKLFWELEGQTALASGGESLGAVTRLWLEETFERVGEVVSEAVKAGVECGSFGLQLLPNAFEMFGVDLLLSIPEGATGVELPQPTISLLEFNASPDFGQSGDRLRPHLAEMFKGVVRIAIAPFFGCDTIPGGHEEQDEGGEQAVGQVRNGWRMVGEAATRGDW